MTFGLRLVNFEHAETARSATFVDALLEGERIRVPNGPLTEPAGHFLNAVYLHTGKAESEWLGSYLLLLSAKNGGWHKVPWRMLRNRYLGYGAVRRAIHSLRKHPVILEEEPSVVYVSDSFEVPVEELLIGVMDAVEHGLVELSRERGETYFFPTQKLIDSVSKTRNGDRFR